MKLAGIKKLLEDNGYTYTQTVIPSRAEFYREKGFHPSADTGAFILLTEAAQSISDERQKVAS